MYLFFLSFCWLLTKWILSSCSRRKPPMAGRFLRQFHWLDWSILAKRRKSQFEEKNSGQIAVSFGRTQLYVCKTKPTFATNEQTLGGTYVSKIFVKLHMRFFHKLPSNSEFATSFVLVLLGAVHKLCRLRGGGGVKNSRFYLVKGVKNLRRHNLWTAPYACKTKLIFATIEQTLGGTYRKSL